MNNSYVPRKGPNMKTNIALLSFLAFFSLGSSAFACSMHEQADAKQGHAHKKQTASEISQSDARAQLGLGNKQAGQESNNQRLPFERHGKSSMTRERVLKN